MHTVMHAKEALTPALLIAEFGMKETKCMQFVSFKKQNVKL
jgi:hypothetical protein